MVIRKRRVTTKGLLKLLSDSSEELIVTSRLDAWRKLHQAPAYHSLDEYFPSVVDKIVQRLAREGLVEKQETVDGMKVKITVKGQEKVLLFQIDDLKPKGGEWDGRWRVVFFDIEEIDHKKRDRLRKYLKKIGLQAYQESVYISPNDVADEVKYLREILEIPHMVKIGMLTEIENEQELKTWFGI